MKEWEGDGEKECDFEVTGLWKEPGMGKRGKRRNSKVN